MMTVFIRVLADVDKASALRAAASGTYGRFVADPAVLAEVPGAPFAYWVSDRLRSLFVQFPPFERDGRTVRQGVATSDNFRFCRSWWELPVRAEDGGWPAFVLGGGVSPFYYRLDLRLNWRSNGREVKAYAETTPGTSHWSRRIPNVEFYGRSGFTWGSRTAKFQPSCVPANAVFSVSRYQAFIDGAKNDEALLAHIGLLNASVVTTMIRMTCEGFERPKFVVGGVQTLPVPNLEPSDQAVFAHLARQGWSHQRSLDTVNEVSHAFVVPAVLRVSGRSFGERSSGWAERVAEVQVKLDRVQAEINDLSFDLYGVSHEDRRAITDGFDANEQGDGGAGDADEGDEDDFLVELDPEGLAAGLVSWAVGVAVGRFDVRLAAGVREWPEEPDPFDPLPVCSAAMLTGDDGLPRDTSPAGYPVDVSAVLVDDPGHEWDLSTRVRAVFDVVFGEDADRWWRDVGAVLDPRGGEVKNWLLKRFCDHHLKTHAKSRRKAPILWPLGTKSGSYRVWLYAHRVTRDSLFGVLSDVIEPKLTLEERRLTDLVQEFGPSPSASQRRTIETQEMFVSELRELRDEVAAVASLWAPDLNDGVVLVLAPLWRLFAHHRAWSNELKSRWKKLAAGEYDWAHLAMHIWPDRVVPKCAEDRSLAIAHKLEDVFWAKDDGKWHPRPTPTISLDQLITERTNPTIHTARQHPQP
jgi:hypothetical protein